MTPRLAVATNCTDPGKTVNEDRAGASGAHAWIVDGASGIAEDRFTPGDSDAAWLAEEIDRGLAALVPETGGADDPDTLLGALETRLAAAFAGHGGLPSGVPDHMAPSAALGLVRLRETAGGLVLDGRFVADVAALVPEAGGGVARWTDERLKPMEALTFAALKDGGMNADGSLSDAAKRQIARNRTAMNRPGGYWVVHPVRPWARERLAFSAPVAPGDAVVLASDGFLRLVDLFAVEIDRSLYDALVAGRAAELLARLRALEADLDLLRAHPRPKARDDATVLVVRAEV